MRITVGITAEIMISCEVPVWFDSLWRHSYQMNSEATHNLMNIRLQFTVSRGACIRAQFSRSPTGLGREFISLMEINLNQRPNANRAEVLLLRNCLNGGHL